ncbi:uncharacterized protein LOC141641375 [Silene latifolia]|uniref:uncharacterized protein LOC141641375 n=1 Tax=Silene latifolia TaxID=37657 RepID=UPI003D773C4C
MGFWNVRGLNNPAKQKHIKWFLHHHQVGLFGFLETKVKPFSLNKISSNICNGWCLSTNSSYHKGGRVWLLWKPNLFDLQFIEYNAQFIHVLVHELATGSQFYLTMVYAFNGVYERKALWSRLQDMSGHIHSPWLICGDFNTVLAPSERLGGSTTEEEMEDFQNCLDICHMVDMPATGSLFTWNNKQEAATRVFSRLDRALVNHEWIDQKKEFYAHFHAEGCFDHTPCIIQRLLRGIGLLKLLGETQPMKAVNAAIVKRGSVCSQEHWDWLNKPVINGEIKEALFQIPSHKAPGPDGYSSAFFKDAWSVVGEDLCEVVKDFSIHGRLLEQLNHTLVTLVPKVELPKDVAQFRPISCCNVVYNIISKLTRVLPDIISSTEGGFIKGRNIIENILVCQDVIRLYNRATVSP